MLLVGAGTATAAPPAPQATSAPQPAAPSSSAPLTNLAHLNFLLDTVPLKPVDGHSTYQLSSPGPTTSTWQPLLAHGPGQQLRNGPAAQLPWGHVTVILDKLDDPRLRVWVAT